MDNEVVKKISVVDFTDGLYEHRATPMVQWNYGQKLMVLGLKLPQATEVHFSLNETGAESTTVISTVENGVTVVSVPSFILEHITSDNYKGYAFIYVSDRAEGRTEHKVVFDVYARPKPEGHNTPEDDELFHSVLEQLRVTLEMAVAAAKDSESYARGGTGTRVGEEEDNAKYYKQQSEIIREDVLMMAKKVAENTLQVEQDRNTVSSNTKYVLELVRKAEAFLRQTNEAANKAERNAEKTGLDRAATAEDVNKTNSNVTKTNADARQTAQDREAAEKIKQSFTTEADQALQNVKSEGEKQKQEIDAKLPELKKSIADNKQAIESKVAKNQGIENSGKILGINIQGEVVPVKLSEGSGGGTGTDGADGFSPIATVSKAGKITTISITDKSGTTTSEVLDGENGLDGQQGKQGEAGKDGFSPVAKVNKVGKTTTITVTDKNGTTTAEVLDGKDGTGGGGSGGGDIIANQVLESDVKKIMWKIPDKYSLLLISVECPPVSFAKANFKLIIDGTFWQSTAMEMGSKRPTYLTTLITRGINGDLTQMGIQQPASWTVQYNYSVNGNQKEYKKGDFGMETWGEGVFPTGSKIIIKGWA